jgi:hypothetical protein
MAREPADRFSKISEMVTALEGYLEESGIEPDRVHAELARYFAGPIDYEKELQPRLVEHLTTRGAQLLAKDERAAALDAFDRVLTLDPKNEKVLAILDGLNRKQLWMRLGIAAAAIAVIGGGAFMIHKKTEPPGADSPPAPDNPGQTWTNRVAIALPDDRPPPVRIEVDAAVVEPAPDATSVAVGSGHPPVNAIPDAGVVEPKPETFDVAINVYPPTNSEIDLGDGNWLKYSPGMTRALRAKMKVKARNKCCVSQEQDVVFGKASLDFTLEFKSAKVIARCEDKSVIVSIDGTQWQLDDNFTVPFGNTTLEQSKPLKVEFTSADKLYKLKSVTVVPGQTLEVTCEQ